VTFESLIQDYGYLAILIITFIEGETIVILAGVAAHLNFLDINWVIVTAIIGSFAGDQTGITSAAIGGRRSSPGACPGRRARRRCTSTCTGTSTG
jgi:membrane protein DedA with SNARE-associated domain